MIRMGSRGEVPREWRVARLRQAARLACSASPREPNVRPDFLPCQSVTSRLLSGKKVGQLAIIGCMVKISVRWPE